MPEYGMRRGGGGGRFGGGGGGRGGGRGGRDDYLDPESEQFRKLFIGGLSYETTEDGLKGHFEQWGEIVDVVVMKDPQTKRSRGFGFVTFKEAAMLDEAQKNRPHTIDGRDVEAKRAMPRAESGRSESQATVKKMFIGGMKDDTTEDQIRDVFSPYGKIESIDIIKDRASQKPKGFAFVLFEDYDTVDKCVLISKFDLNGKKVDVKKAQAKESGGGGGAGGRGSRGGGRPGGRGDFGGSGGYNSGGYGGGGYGGGQSYGGGSGYGGGSNWGGNQGGGYDNYSGGYSQGGGGGNWGGNEGFGQNYAGSYGGGAMRGGGNYSQRDTGPYGGGYGSSGGYGSGSGYGGGGGYNRS